MSTNDVSLPVAKRIDPIHGLQGFVALDALARLTIWNIAMIVATVLTTRWFGWPETGPLTRDWGVAWAWGQRIGTWVILFNNSYVLELLLLRMLIPTPKEGVYRLGGKLDRQLIWAAFVAVLTKARYEAPFPGFIVFHASNLPPISWAFGAVFGPKTKSCYVVDPRIIDPYMVTIGRNVTIGFDAMIIGHVQERDQVTIARTVIEDDVLVGGGSIVTGGVHIKQGSVVGAASLVTPGTVIGPNEFWAGTPARKIKDLPAPGAGPASAAVG